MKFTKDGKKNYLILNDDKKDKIQLDINNSIISNKFQAISSVILEAYNNIPEYKNIFDVLISNDTINFDLVSKIFECAELYVDSKNIDFNSFCNKKKSTKKSILFEPQEIRKLAVSSVVLKLLSLFLYTNNSEFKLDNSIDREIKNKIIDYCSNVFEKIFKIVSSNIRLDEFRDEYMWKYLQFTLETTLPTHILSIYSFLVNKELVALDIESNPISFFTTIIKDKTKWLMTASYSDKIVYTESFSSLDAYSEDYDIDLLHKFCLHEFVYRLSDQGMKFLYSNILENVSPHEYKNSDLLKDLESIVFSRIENRLNRTTQIHPIHFRLTIPLLCKEFNLSFKELLTVSPKLITLCGVYLYNYSKIINKDEFPNLSQYLLFIPRKENNIEINKKSHYVFKNMNLILNSDISAMGEIKSKSLIFDIMSDFVGVLVYYRSKISSILTDRPLNIVTEKLEKESVKMYNILFD